ncbi:hypothetical protein TVAG_039190 [Trichomonas vaginalis G3]|uniref:HEAT repeat family protein n=1 Tax=Trichomonas vaginalis (strain ATCC PRA-98 / G3) TaxID=412133 RepID=A2E5N0_TRIV3|nr:armadillo (ARM) repeat-containing protein family [Trichomonas vaginalis G3]EAY12071.1 hypothetical protein TVAG_039190 [Trichomonas vaginalis G3]KAI5553177.1 armadillo (ARM) repeat-containing protein family [Trichomonas vaginalis G3]|eukprot:XP_001324294.1 hypothetical protein [Trichomonas vaginalis G3]
MENLLAHLGILAQAKHLVPAEQVIMTDIEELNVLLSKDVSPDLYPELEKTLLSLFSINSGQFSVQCAIHIASTLVKVYDLMKRAEYWNIINIATDNPTTATLVATGYIIKNIGNKFKSQLPRFIEHCLKQTKFEQACLYSLTASLEAGGKSVYQFIPRAFDYCRKTLLKCNQTTMQEAITFLRTIVNIISSGETTNVTIPQILDTIRICFQQNSPFIRSDIANLVAACAYEPFYNVDTTKSVSEWDVGKMKHEAEGLDFTKSFGIIQSFPSIIDLSVSAFFQLLGPEIIFLNHSSLMKFIRQSSFSSISKLISNLPSDIRYMHFKNLIHENLSVQQIKLMSLLCPDDGSIGESSNVAFKAAISDDKELRRVAKEFFSALAKTHPQAALPALSLALTTAKSKYSQQEIAMHSIYCAVSILKSIDQKNLAAENCRSQIESLLKISFHEIDVNSYSFSSVLLLLAYLPEEFSESEISKKAISTAIDSVLKDKAHTTLRTFKKLLSSLFSLVENNENSDLSKHLLIAALMANNIKLPRTVLLSFLKLVPKVLKDQPLALSTALMIVRFSLGLIPSTDLVVRNRTRPLPVGKNLLKQEEELTYQQKKDDEFLQNVIENLSVLLVSCPIDDVHVVVREILEQTTQTQTTILLLISIVKENSLHQTLPTNFPSFILSLLLQPGNEKLQQLLCELLSIFVSFHLELLGKIFNHVDAKPFLSSTILIDSIFSHMSVPSQFISRAIVYLDCRMKDKTQMMFAIHAITTIILTHAMQVASLGITANQFNVLLQALHSHISLSPTALFIFMELFKVLVETVSSDILSHEKEIAVILRSFQFTPIEYSKEIYYECSRAVYTFAHNLSYLAPISFNNNLTNQASLACCSAFYDLMKFETCEFENEKLLPRLLVLLQETKDKRCSNFIIQIASTMKLKDVQFWISNCRRILITGSLLQNSTTTIEPCPEVRLCFMTLSKYIPKLLSEMPVLKTEYLDDLISSVCRATDTDRVALQEAAFPILQNVIDLFRDRFADEGGRLLDLYDSQFSQTVRVGFQLPLIVSGGFLSTYLSFSTSNIKTDPENCANVLVVYVTGLSQCKQRNSSYFQLATHLCNIARNYPMISDLIGDFLKTLSPIFVDIVLRAMNLYKDRNDWRSLTKFRSLAQSFYRELLSAFIWLQSKEEKKVIKSDSLVAFLAIELQHSQENWLSLAAFDALSVALRQEGAKIDPRLVKLSLEVAANYKGVNKSQVSELIDSCASLLTENSEYDELRKTVLSLTLTNHFSPTVLGHLIHSDKKSTLSIYAEAILDGILTNLTEKKITSEIAGALINLLISHSPKVSGSTIDRVLDLSDDLRDFKLQTISRCLLHKNIEVPLEKLSRFCISSFKRGGMNLIAKCLIHNEDVGVSLLSRGACKAAFLLAQKDLQNSRAYFLFLHLVLNTLQKSDKVMCEEFCVPLLKLCISFTSKLKVDSQIDRKLYAIVARICKDCVTISPQKCSYAFNEVNENERKQIMTMTEVCINAEKQRMKTEQLVAFSTNQRSSRNEWQTLDIED